MRIHNRAIEMGFFLSLAATVALAVAAEPMIRVLYQRGAFTSDDTVKVAAALTAIEFRASSYWHRMRDRANVLCETLGYQGFSVSSRWNPLTTTGAGFYLHVAVTILWFVSLFIRVHPAP